MTRSELEHVIRAAGTIADDRHGLERRSLAKHAEHAKESLRSLRFCETINEAEQSERPNLPRITPLLGTPMRTSRRGGCME